MPKQPPGNSNISSAMQFGSPLMRAMPSPASMTSPTSSVPTAVLYLARFCERTLEMDLGSNLWIWGRILDYVIRIVSSEADAGRFPRGVTPKDSRNFPERGLSKAKLFPVGPAHLFNEAAFVQFANEARLDELLERIGVASWPVIFTQISDVSLSFSSLVS